MNGVIVLIGFIAVLLCILSMRVVSGFMGAIPKGCGTAGIRMSDAAYRMAKKMGGTDLTTTRWYTESECNKLPKGTFKADANNGGKCYRLKDSNKDITSDNIDFDYSEQCAGLNQTYVSPPPTECLINGKPAGKPNVAFSFTNRGETTLIEDASFQLHTENECKLLGGDRIVKLQDIMAGDSQEETQKMVQSNGADYGLCLLPNGAYLSAICTVNPPATAGAKIGAAAKSALKDWLSS